MASNINDENSSLLQQPTGTRKIAHPEIDVGTVFPDPRRFPQAKELFRWKATAIISWIITVGFLFVAGIHEGNNNTTYNTVDVHNNDGNDGNNGFGGGLSSLSLLRKHPKCKFCRQQSPPTLHHEKSYTIRDGIVVTPMTVTYEYELHDGEILFTQSKTEHLPNLDFDYAVLEVGAIRNLNRETNEAVSLDEVYVHHFTLQPLHMIGAEALGAASTNLKLPEGYAVHIRTKDAPHFSTNAHLISNKNLAPIDKSLPRARKECNECYYAPGKGSDCTPETSGTFLCCGDSFACIGGGEDCSCATTTLGKSISDNNKNKKHTTKYRIELDFLISKEIDRFQRIDAWTFTAPLCANNIHGEGLFDRYPTDSFCANFTAVQNLKYGGGALFHQVPENNTHPYRKTSISVVAPAKGKLLTAHSHLHTGGVNATLRRNGEVVCTTTTRYGKDPNPHTNARNEKNHLVEIESCDAQLPSEGIIFDEGDVFTTESLYYVGRDDLRMSEPGAAGGHKNVMSYFGMSVVFEGTAEFVTSKDRSTTNLFNNFVPAIGLRQ